MKLVLAKVLVITAFILALIDAVAADALPFDMAIGGIVFGLSTIIFSTFAFIISFKQKSVFVAILLVATGLVITTSGIIETQNLNLLYIPGPILGVVFGLWVVALGIAKSIRTGRQTRTSPMR